MSLVFFLLLWCVFKPKGLKNILNPERTPSTKEKQCECVNHFVHEQRWRPRNSEGKEKVNFVGPCWVLANNEPLSVCLLTHRHTHTIHSPQQRWHCKRYCMCVYAQVHTHTDIYAYMCMLVNTHTLPLRSPQQNVNLTESVYYKKVDNNAILGYCSHFIAIKFYLVYSLFLFLS